MSFVRKSLLVSSGQVLVVGLNVLGTMILARVLTEGMGQYDLFRNVAMLAVAMAALGIGNANIYVLNGRGASVADVVGNSLTILVAVGAALAVGTFAAVLTWNDYFGNVHWLIAFVFGLGVWALLGTALLRSILVAQLAARRMTTVDGIAPGLVLAGAVLLAVGGLLRAQSAIALYASGNLLAFAVLAAYLSSDLKPGLRFRGALMRLVLRHGVRLFASNALQVGGGSLTVVLLRYLTLDGDRFGPVAFYTRAVGLCGLALLVPTALGPLLYARWSGAQPDVRRREVQLVARASMAYGAATVLLLVVGGRFLLRALYGPAFVPAQAAVYALAPAAALNALFNVHLNLFAADGRADLTAWVLAIATVVTVASTFLFVPSWGMVGAAVGTLLGAAVSVLVASSVAARRYGVRAARCLLLRRDDLHRLRASFRQNAVSSAPRERGTA